MVGRIERGEYELMEEYELMIPGPTQVEQRVLLKMSERIVPHYGKEWVEYYWTVIEKLKKVLGAWENVFVMVGSGHLGLEAVINSAISEGDKIVVFVNGFFGQRIAEIASTYTRDVHIVNVEWGKAISEEVVRDTLRRIDGRPKLAAVVHLETSTGVLNPVREIAKQCRERDIPLMVDAVSSVGTTPIKVDEWGVDYCVTVSQKGLGAPPGLVIVSASSEALRKAKVAGHLGKGWYLNISKWEEFSKEKQPYFITMAVNNIRALDASLSRLLEEGLENVYRRHYEVAKAFRLGIRQMGLSIIADEDVASSAVTAVLLSEGVPSAGLATFLKRKYRIVVGKGLGIFEGQCIRVGHMAEGARLNRILPVLFGIEDYLRLQGRSIPIGTSLVGIQSVGNGREVI